MLRRSVPKTLLAGATLVLARVCASCIPVPAVQQALRRGSFDLAGPVLSTCVVAGEISIHIMNTSAQPRSFARLFLGIGLALACWWALTAAVLFGIVQLSGAHIEFRSVLHATGYGVCPVGVGAGVCLVRGGVGWTSVVALTGAIGSLAVATTLHSTVWLKYRSSARWFGSGNAERDALREQHERGRRQGEAGAERGAAAGALAGFALQMCAISQIAAI